MPKKRSNSNHAQTNRRKRQQVPKDVVKAIEQLASGGRSNSAANVTASAINSAVTGAATGSIAALATGEAIVTTPILWGLLGASTAIAWPVVLTWAAGGAALAAGTTLLGAGIKHAHEKEQAEAIKKELEKQVAAA